MDYDVVVVGGSYAGLSAAMQLVRAHRRVLVVDSKLPRNRFATAAHGFFAQDGKPPFEILREATRQVLAYPTATLAADEVLGARKRNDGFAITMKGGREENAARLILATGVRDELPAVPGLRERWGVTVLHCPYCHGYETGGGDLGVLANHSMSAHQALLLPDWGKTTYFTQGTFEPEAEEARQLAARGVQIERTPITELLGDAPALEAVRLSDGRVLKMQAIFTAPRVQLAGSLAEQLGCALEGGPMGPYVRVDEWKQTTVLGVYAAGDTASAMHNATFASAAGVTAGVGAHQSLVKDAAQKGVEKQ